LDLLLVCLQQDDVRFNSMISEPSLNWQYFIDLAIHHRVFPLIYKYFKTKETDYIPSSVRETLKWHVIDYSFQDEAIKAALQEIAVTLNHQAINYCLLKGPVLGQILYGNSALRPSKDLDILIGQEHVGAVINLLEGLGFEVEKVFKALKVADWEAFFKREYHISLYKGRVMVELHWRLMSSKHPVVDGFRTDTLLRQTVARDYEGITVSTLRPEDEFVYLVIHGAVHCWFRLRWLNDIVRYLEKCPDLNFELVREGFMKNQMQNSFYQLLLLISRLYGEDKVKKIIRPEEITFSSRRLYEITFPFLKSTKDTSEYHPLSAGYYKKLLYVFWLLPHNQSRLQFLKYQLSINSGESMPRLFIHFRRIFKPERK